MIAYVKNEGVALKTNNWRIQHLCNDNKLQQIKAKVAVDIVFSDTLMATS